MKRCSVLRTQRTANPDSCTHVDFCCLFGLKFDFSGSSYLQLVVSMASRAATLPRELKKIESEMHFMQERCKLFEEENKRLRDGYDNGVAPEEFMIVLKMLLPHILVFCVAIRRTW
jgi:hypothetical protein